MIGTLRIHTLGARGFSCAVSGIGHSAAEAKRSILVRRAREKTSGIQGNAYTTATAGTTPSKKSVSQFAFIWNYPVCLSVLKLASA